MAFDLSILGTGSATPAMGRNPSAQLLVHHHHHFLIDCGEGTQMQLRRFHLKAARINHIFISHLHGDHYLGLPGFLASLHLQNRTQDLHLYCHEPLKEILEVQFKHSDTWLRFPIIYHFLEEGKAAGIYEDEHLYIEAFPLNHRIACHGFVFREKEKPLPLRKEALALHKVSPEFFPKLKRGEDFVLPDGTILPNRLFTLPRPDSYSYGYCSDTMYDASITEHIRGVSLLYHESTFLTELESRARETYHSTAAQAAIMARESGAQQLLLGHFSARYRDLQPFADEASALFSQVMIAEEGKTYRIGSLVDNP
jgi:ribonuclease Z